MADTFAGRNEDLERLVHTFNEDLTASVRAFTGEDYTFSFLAVDHFSVSVRLKPSHDDIGMIPLKWQGIVILGVVPTYKCVLDSSGTRLAIQNSSFKVYAGDRAQGEPLFRVEYDRDKSTKPSSHFHVHGHRNEFTHLLGLKRKLSSDNEAKIRKFTKTIPSLSEFHFPTGGPRFRPCLEDILECLRDEFDLDVNQDTWVPQLTIARAKWRKIQTAAAVRDCPDIALQVLAEDFGLAIPEDWTAKLSHTDAILRP